MCCGKASMLGSLVCVRDWSVAGGWSNTSFTITRTPTHLRQLVPNFPKLPQCGKDPRFGSDGLLNRCQVCNTPPRPTDSSLTSVEDCSAANCASATSICFIRRICADYAIILASEYPYRRLSEFVCLPALFPKTPRYIRRSQFRTSCHEELCISSSSQRRRKQRRVAAHRGDMRRFSLLRENFRMARQRRRLLQTCENGKAPDIFTRSTTIRVSSAYVRRLLIEACRLESVRRCR